MKILFTYIVLFFSLLNPSDDDKVSPKELKSIISNSKYEFNIVYVYTDWCSPCVEEFPNVLKLCKENDINIHIIILSKEGNANLIKFKEKFKKKYNFTEPIYNYSYDESIVKTLKKSNYRNFQAFIKEFLGEKYNENIIYGSDNLILINNKLNFIYISEFGSYEKKYENIKNNI